LRKRRNRPGFFFSPSDTINVANTIDLQNNATLSVSIGTTTQSYPFMTKSRRQLKKELGG